MKKEYEILFTPAKIGNVEIKNRFVLTTMSFNGLVDFSGHAGNKGTNSDSAEEMPNHDFMVARAKDGVGLICSGVTIHNFNQPGDWIHQHPEVFAHLKAMVDEIHSYGTKISCQLGNGSGKAFAISKASWEQYQEDPEYAKVIDYVTMSADGGLPNRFIPELKTTAMTKEKIKDIIHSSAETAYILKQCGVDMVEIHSSHEGYMLDQFLSPFTNHRTDEYGGSLENRLRFNVELVQAIKEKCGKDFPVLLRYSVESRVRDFGKGRIPADTRNPEIGKTLEESKQALKILAEAGYDGFDLDNGSYDAWYYAHPPVYMPENCNLDNAIAIKETIPSMPTICAGRMQIKEAAEAISAGKLTFIGLARQIVADEHFITKIREEREEDIIPCISCHQGCLPVAAWTGSGAIFGKVGSCALNPHTSHEKTFNIVPTNTPKKIAVIGAGVSGMEFAFRATQRGHDVTIYEKSGRLGGVFNEATSFSFKGKERDLLAYYKTQLKKASVKIELNCNVERLEDIQADEYVIATGSARARKLPIPGGESAIGAVDFLKQGRPCGDKIAIIGGGLTGSELAYELAKDGKHPFIIEMAEDILIDPGTCMANTSYLRDSFEYYGVDVYTCAKTQKYEDGLVTFVDKNGTTIEREADTVIVSIGFELGIPFDIDGKANVHRIGDADKIANLMHAVHSAYELAMTI